MQPQNPYTPAKPSKLPLLIVSVLLIIALIFGLWAFSKMQDYKKNSDKKAAVAVASAKKQQEQELKKQFDEQAKSPYKQFNGSATYGSISFNYPKSWNVYSPGSSDEPINSYFFNGEVPAIDSDAAFPLRAELVSTDYAEVVGQFTEQISSGNLRASAYIPPKMKAVKNVAPGTRFDGVISQGSSGDKTGSMVVIKVRDKTLQIYTLSKDSVSDFDNIILSSLSFVP